MSGSRRNRGAPARLTAVVAILLLVLSDATFDLYFWRIPKVTGVLTDFGYESLSTVHRLERGKREHAIRMVALGSSVVISFDAYQVANLIETADHTVRLDVSRLLLPGAKPSDYRLLWDAKGEAMRVDIAVVVLNLGDFLNPSFEGQLKEQVRYVLPPWQTLKERHAFVGGLSGQLDLMLASVSHFYRYRKLIRSSIQDHVKLALRGLRRHGRLHAYGVYPDGYARQQWGLPLADVGNQTLEYYVDPEWIHQQGQVRLKFSVDGTRIAERVEAEPGWKRIGIPVPTRAGILHVAADSAWTPRATGRDGDARLLGVRLRQPLPPDLANDDVRAGQFTLIAHRQCNEFLRMGGSVGEEFVDRWRQAVAADTPFGQRMRGYEKEKLAICQQAFEPRGEHAEAERLVAELSRQGTAVVIVNSPESPLILSSYQESAYYRAHVEFLRGLAQKYRGVRFYDLASSLPVEDFNDWDHPSYVGTIKLGPRYAEMARQAIADWKVSGPSPVSSEVSGDAAKAVSVCAHSDALSGAAPCEAAARCVPHSTDGGCAASADGYSPQCFGLVAVAGGRRARPCHQQCGESASDVASG
jgi:hypothetical protein